MTSPPVNPPSFPMEIETYHEIGFRHVVGTLTLTDEALHFQQDFNEDTHEQEEIDLSAVTQAEHQHSNGTTHKTDELMRRSWDWSSIKKFKVIDSTLSENKKMIQLTKFHNKNTVISLTVNDDDNLLKIVNGMGIRLTIVHNKLQQLKEQEKKLKHQRASLSQSENLHLRSSAASVGSNKSKESHTGSQYSSRGSLKKKATISPLSMSQSENHHSRTRTSKQSSNKNQDHSKLSPLSMSQSDNQHTRTARRSKEQDSRSNGTPPRPSRTLRARKERDSTASLPPLQAIDITPPHDPSAASPKSQGSSPDSATRKLRRPSNLLTPKFPLLRPPPAHDHRRLQKQTSVPALMGRNSLIGHSNDPNSTGSNEGDNDASKVLPATPPTTRRGLLGGSGRAFSSRLLSGGGGGKQLSSRLLLGGRQTSTRDMTVTEASPRTTTANITEDILPATTTTGSSSNAATRKKMPLLHFLKKPPSRRHLGGDGSMNEDWTERSHSQSQTNNNNFHESFSKISTPPIAE